MQLPLVLVPQYFGSLLFDRRTSRYLPFDTASTAVMGKLCDVSMFDLLVDEEEVRVNTQAEASSSAAKGSDG